MGLIPHLASRLNLKNTSTMVACSSFFPNSMDTSIQLCREEKFPVIGVTPAVIGCIQATEVIKYLVGLGKLLTNRLLVYDGLNMKFTELVVKRDASCEHCRHLPAKE